MIELVQAHTVRDGAWVIREPYDTSLQPSDYDEKQAVQVMHVTHDSDRLLYGRQAHFHFKGGESEHIGLNTYVLICTQDRERPVLCTRCFNNPTMNRDAVCNRCKEK